VENKTLFELNFEVWLLIADLQHKMALIRDKELSQHGITPRQMHILRLIDALGPKARLSIIAKAVERKIDVVSRQTATMEKDGLITRVKAKSKSRLLNLELTERGRELLKISRYSDGMNKISSVLTENELLQVDVLLKRLLAEIKEYDPECNNERLF